MPPFVPNTSGVKVPISTSITLWLYFLFFSFSCSISEELKEKIKQSASLKCEINSIYDEIRQSCSLFRYASILRAMVNLRNKHYQEVMSTHTKKVARLLYKETDVDEHIHNISSYSNSLSSRNWFCVGIWNLPCRNGCHPLKWKRVLRNAYWSLESHLGSDDLKELAAATLRFVVLNYIQRKVQKFPKTLLLAIDQLKQRDDIVITKPESSHDGQVWISATVIRSIHQWF